MIQRLRLERFRSFERAELTLGPLTVLVGANASGKSNIRDAFRFLHGIARGYTLAEILGEKYAEGGYLQWRGIRGGPREIAYRGADTFVVDLRWELASGGGDSDVATYTIGVRPGDTRVPPRVVAERLHLPLFGPFLFDSHPETDPLSQQDPHLLKVRVGRLRGRGRYAVRSFPSYQPVLSQFSATGTKVMALPVEHVLGSLGSMRFLDLSPDAMRQPSLPGQQILGDRGENLSSVMHAICADDGRKTTLLEWIRELTPMDAVDFEFPAGPDGKILLTLVEKSGQRISAYSASDGTLRFLAMIAALLGPEPAHFYFFEELDNGIHPARLHLLLELVERTVAESTIQMVVTTHSPQLLTLLSPQSLEHAYLTYRLPDAPDARVRRILDIPEARRVIEEQDLARLHESGWLEDAVYFTEPETREAAA